MTTMRLTVLLQLSLVMCGVQHSLGQLVKTGQCPSVSVKQDFDVNRYLGTWYQYATFGTRLFQGEGRCVTARYTLNTTTGGIDVFNSQIPKEGTFPSMSSIKGTAELADPHNIEGKLIVTFPAPVIRSIRAPYWVLDTDYDSFAVVYSCVDARLAHALSGWILTRVQDVDHSPQDKARLEAKVAEVLTEANLPRSLFVITDQGNCDR
ncbi:apolipoprotein D-like isoform X1 [Macrosteles quadrilineatus]|uniref:apolipoprotein D-like isoform X1 n=2 Tax=Macrosteles quadrilineatus TaxID=74068 RepID=UPI0023E13A47|nr:apolipoprotein D-like isoform X1 [Macrosteles quadrilineatus]